ncbi:uncharacterized protein LOC120349641 [Nilaparvata lugens]|uniref:uncharacterized protein LOC120349641 n=1 Tax=Nilaparvata lugens TaxID=108931 RepID=UPI00193D622C|nr:uncharacterized protein LOC120349641 [Nilaparvata lugens]
MPNEPLSTYILAIKYAAKLLRLNKSEEEIVNDICSGLNPEERSRLFFQNKPSSFAQLTEMSVTSQNILFADRERSKFVPNNYGQNSRNVSNRVDNVRNRCYRCNNLGHISAHCRTNLGNDNKGHNSRNSGSQNPSRENRNWDTSKITCYKCNELGHYASNCNHKKSRLGRENKKIERSIHSRTFKMNSNNNNKGVNYLKSVKETGNRKKENTSSVDKKKLKGIKGRSKRKKIKTFNKLKIRALRKNVTPFINCKMENSETSYIGLIDSGSDVSVISKPVFNELLLSGSDLEIVEDNQLCVTANKSKLLLSNTVLLKIKIEHFSWKFRFYIHETLSTPIILGADFIHHTQLVPDIRGIISAFVLNSNFHLIVN